MLRAFLFACLGLVLLLAWHDELPDVEIRYAPRQTQAGRIFPGHALGQGFVCDFDGLHAIDVALAPIGGELADLELALRADDPHGAELRRVRVAAAALPASDDWVRFEFEPLADSAGRSFWFELHSSAASSHAPWVRYRGVPYLVRPWGDRVLTGSHQEGDLLPAPPRPRTDLQHSDLRALAFAVDGVDAAAAPAVLTLSDPRTGKVLRRSELAPRAPHATGWMFFEFEVLHDTRWRALHYALDLPEGARLIGGADGHSIVAFHSTAWAHPSVLGATCRGDGLHDRDLVFRAWSEGSRANLLSRLYERSSSSLVSTAIAWVLSVAALSALLLRARPDDD
jgi:hypothetical protein